jgi:acyl carrier protein
MTINNETKQQIRKFISDSTFKDLSAVKDDTLIFREGIFDSMGFVLLIDYIEENFGIKASDDDLIETNFESIEAISKFIENKRILKPA